jgi:plasmid replication initiation protein
MQETSITFVEQNVFEEHIAILPYFKFSYGGKIEVKIFSKILNLIREVTNRFTIIDVKNLMNLKSKHSVRMILLLEMISGFSENVAKRKHYSLAELNGMFGTNYPRLKEFERKILMPVQKELNEKSKLSFIYEVEFDKEDISSRGRPKAVGIVLDLIKKEQLDSDREQNRIFLEWVNKIRREYVNEILLYHPDIEANLRVSPKGLLYWDNGNELKASKAKEFWKWMYKNQEKLIIKI